MRALWVGLLLLCAPASAQVVEGWAVLYDKAGKQIGKPRAVFVDLKTGKEVAGRPVGGRQNLGSDGKPLTLKPSGPYRGPSPIIAGPKQPQRIPVQPTAAPR